MNPPPPIIPIVILDEDVELPDEGTCYIVANGGVYVRKVNEQFSATVKLDTQELQGVKEGATWFLPSIPEALVAEAYSFFRAVYERNGCEAIVLLYYSHDTKQYRLVCPRQSVSPSDIDYDSSDQVPGHMLVGTIHSHAKLDAFHSGADEEDEESFDGLHVTFGNVDRSEISISASMVVNGKRFIFEQEVVIEGITKSRNRPRGRHLFRVSLHGQSLFARRSNFPYSWMSRVRKS